MDRKQLYPKVAIVIVNWNKKEFVLNLLSSLRELNYPDYDIIVVDNASTDGSVEAIRQIYPNIKILVNEENLGGTGGFNTGMRYALNKGWYKYIWLLDNDAEVEKNSLIELVNAMESDEKIGIAGSRILDKVTNITVECGGYIRKDTIGVVPYMRNCRMTPANKYIDVDYVAVCSALVRTNALLTVGLMDERFFLFWDDMDWGWSFKDKGYRVVAVTDSIVYHPSFTERDRGLLTKFYYGIRNPLLTYSKHLHIFRLMKIYYNYIRYLGKGIIFLLLSGEKISFTMCIFALRDFYKGRWGNIKWLNKSNFTSHNWQQKNVENVQALLSEAKRILVIGLSATRDEILLLWDKLSLYVDKVTLLIQDDRRNIYNDLFTNILIFRSLRMNFLLYNIKFFMRLFLSRYDVVIATTFSPFLNISKNRFLFKESKFIDVRKSTNFFFILASILIGEVTAILLTPFLVLRGIKWRNSREFLSS